MNYQLYKINKDDVDVTNMQVSPENLSYSVNWIGLDKATNEVLLYVESKDGTDFSQFNEHYISAVKVETDENISQFTPLAFPNEDGITPLEKFLNGRARIEMTAKARQNTVFGNAQIVKV